MKYILVQWPESQYLMDHSRFHECLFVEDINGHDEVGFSAYMCPEDLYEEVFNKIYEDDSPLIFKYRDARILSVRAYNSICKRCEYDGLDYSRMTIKTFARRYSILDLKKVRSCGKKTIMELKAFFKNNNIKWREV